MTDHQSPPTPATTSLPPIDAAALSESCMNNASLVALVLDKFEKQLRGDLLSLAAAGASGDSAAVARTAHALKGASAVVAAAGVRELAAKLEASGKAGDLAAFEPVLASLRSEIDRCLAFLPTLRPAQSAQPA